MTKAKPAKVMSSKVSLRPTPGNLLLEPEEATRQTASGIVLPESAGEKPQKAKVIAVGEAEILDSGKERNAPCKVGASVYYKKWGGNEIKVEGKEYILVKFDDILAVEE